MPHFEIHASDVDLAKPFHSGLFGRNLSPIQRGEEVGYHLIEGDQIGSDKMLTSGLMRRMGAAPAAGNPVRGGTITDCDDRYARTLANDGAEALPPTNHPGVGRCAYVEDGQGKIVGMITPAPEEN